MLLFLWPRAYNVYSPTAKRKARQQRIILGSCSPMYEAHSVSKEPQAKSVPFLKDEIARASRARDRLVFSQCTLR